MVDQERSKRIIQALNDKGVSKPCPRCGHLHFSVVAETALPLNYNPLIASVLNEVVPTVVIACSNCGFLTQHATGALDLISEVARAG